MLLGAVVGPLRGFAAVSYFFVDGHGVPATRRFLSPDPHTRPNNIIPVIIHGGSSMPASFKS